MKKFVIAIAIAATATMAFASPQGGFARRSDRAAHLERFAEKLGLSADQKAKIEEIRKANYEKNKQLFTDFRAKRAELKQLKQSNDPRADEVKGQLQSMSEQVRAARKSENDAILEVLTPEQRTQLQQLRAQKRSRG